MDSVYFVNDSKKKDSSNNKICAIIHITAYSVELKNDA